MRTASSETEARIAIGVGVVKAFSQVLDRERVVVVGVEVSVRRVLNRV